MTTESLPEPQLLDDDTAARVLKEMIVLGKVDEKEIDRICNRGGGLTDREIAIAFRMSTVLEIPDPFALPPLYALARKLVDIGKSEGEVAVTNLLVESILVGCELDAVERESLLLSTLARIWPEEGDPLDVLAAIDRRVDAIALEAVQ